jgi:23S rRNA (pseudouridine1915-N3)-methyltransferase
MATGGNNMETDRRRAHARAARAVPLKLVIVSKGGGKAMDAACKEWSDKIKRYAPFSETTVKQNPKNAKSPLAQLEAEGERVMKHLNTHDFVVLMDERGETLTSEQLAALVADAGDGGSSACAFVVGGPFGHGDAVIKRANRKIKLSSMVMNHQVARLVLLEQIYRAWTILRGEPYHH